MQTLTAAVVGASGYSGLELTRLLARHPRLRLVALYSDRWADEAAGARLPLPQEMAALRYLPQAHARGQRVVALCGDFRLHGPAAYPHWYGFEHAAPALLGVARYGRPELDRAGLRGATLITNPGCYATAIALALSPLVRSGLVSRERIAVAAMSGVSGAGRKASEDYSFVEIDEDLRAYRIGRHQHVPEIEQTVARYAGGVGALSFTPHLVPIRRGILATCVLRAAKGATDATVRAALDEAYGAEPK